MSDDKFMRFIYIRVRN